MNYYKTSLGERISKKEINKRIREVKALKISQQLNEYGYNFCQDCADNFFPTSPCQYIPKSLEFRILDVSHEISVDECQKNGISEIACDLNNMRIRCRFHHKLHDKTNLKFKENEKR